MATKKDMAKDAVNYEELFEALFARNGNREEISATDWVEGWVKVVGGVNGIPTTRQFNTLQYISDLKGLYLYANKLNKTGNGEEVTVGGKTLKEILERLESEINRLSNVAFSGDYNDLINVPDMPDMGAYALRLDLGNKEDLSTTNKSSLVAAVNELSTEVIDLNAEVSATKKSVSDGKGKIAAAVTRKKVATAAGDSFDTMAGNIDKIKLGSGNATPDKVLQGATFTNDSGVEQSGTMPNQGGVSASLNGGAAYTIPTGYHNGSGRVMANGLSGQTPGTAVAGDILNGKTAWVNGNKLTGNIQNFYGRQSHIPYTRMANGRVEFAVEAGYHGCDWNNSYEWLSYSEMASLIGLTPEKLVNGANVLGISGTYKPFAYKRIEATPTFTSAASVIKEGTWTTLSVYNNNDTIQPEWSLPLGLAAGDVPLFAYVSVFARYYEASDSKDSYGFRFRRGTDAYSYMLKLYGAIASRELTGIPDGIMKPTFQMDLNTATNTDDFCNCVTTLSSNTVKFVWDSGKVSFSSSSTGSNSLGTFILQARTPDFTMSVDLVYSPRI